jgi:hypothetical protein
MEVTQTESQLQSIRTNWEDSRTYPEVDQDKNLVVLREIATSNAHSVASLSMIVWQPN